MPVRFLIIFILFYFISVIRSTRQNNSLCYKDKVKDVAHAVLCAELNVAVCAMGTTVYSSQFNLSLKSIVPI